MDEDIRDQLVRDAQALSGLSLIIAATKPDNLLELVGATQLAAVFDLMRTLAGKVDNGLAEVLSHA
ncbi:hypothetical protein [Burkholderia gladioli]|uniref:hypothetical protein n=1 Tax=Burkholderia gladioli TaxID=28095 RepID=UPI00164121BD|nr:hypothetical protein [Burkholderia gladioli]